MEIDRIIYLREKEKLSFPQIADKADISTDAVKKRYYRAKEKQEFESTPTSPDLPLDDLDLIFHDKKEAENVDWREILESAISTQKILQRLSQTQQVATIEIKTSKPIGIIYTGDWHLGDAYTDHETWRRDIETIVNHPRLHMIDLGDDYQNVRAFKNLSVVLNQVLSPKLQAKLMKSLIDELTDSDTLVAKIGGNHDEEFDERIFGERLQDYFLTQMKAPQFSNRGLVKLQIGDEVYTNLLFHKSRFRSFLRAVHGAYREYQLSFPADVVCGGHDHQPGFEMFHHYTLARDIGMQFGGESFLMKIGTYQASPFGFKYFHNGGFPYNIGVVYWPFENKKLMLPSIEDTIRYLDSVV